ncbi:uncharacterized protein [Leuresthes tenuis]|uniref:uncharacterized protein n=1 Tax=Leuresthes tenuis TaxID=355514 RepID=UPI003B5062E0
MSSSFWDESHSEEVSGETYVKFDGLKSGSKYQFQVQTVAGKRKSEPRIHSESTDPDKMEISLSMICSTMEADACDPKYAADYVNGQLEKLFNDLLKGEVFWELKK